ncbi:FAD/FMN-containing dehydrogenase [Faunimonas pinastri]|uniref:D-2-hydroxyglutarate dehydrogenase n=1 Tax=Faunimonas pinastri TaxID=1855383 RepID=A0A1H9PLF0_9HYPH|nr:FAD-binding and (Fe-S)-binding domain-containing protein [Faunimonas pinastri]SER49042.1 FAD/FMN-containing dehydrogenase [Faunimonas pinastri]
MSIPAGGRLWAFREALASEGYRGEFAGDRAARLVASTDNSIYQVEPLAVLYPREPEDLNRIVRAAHLPSGEVMPLCARGGGTGTNGQSLTRGISVDVSRHMNAVLAFDPEGREVVVQPGMVLDQLNAFLAPHGLFFPPNVSTATRATIGGMVGTDASGKGSRIYGKTSAYIEALDIVLSDGSDWRVRRMGQADLQGVMAGRELAAAIHRETHRVVTEQADLIAATFPDMNRGLTGYNLKHVLRENGDFDLAFLLAGSEGTLALTKAITLRLLPLPRHRGLIVARYDSFDTALRSVAPLLAAEPAAIEILDDKVLALAEQDIVWSGIQSVFERPTSEPVRGLTFIEFVGDDRATLQDAMAGATLLLETAEHRALDWITVTDPALIKQLWTLREKAVGLMGRLAGPRQGTAFVEDTAVPPESLADYVAEFRALLDRRGLAYGMYGHADVGCLHVRPALDMRDPHDAALIRPITDEVAALTRRYGGLLWGEHGRGFRGEYSPLFFGPELYRELCRLKAVFDPLNLFNPGKLAVPDERLPIDRIDGVPLRGALDRGIDARHAEQFDRAIACNGNGACFNWNDFDAMCPSYKATRDRVQSPKGRATLLRTWARLASGNSGEAVASAELAEVEAELKASLDTCLSCKACASQCPVKVDIPTMKSRFLSSYYERRRRPLRDRLIGNIETLLPIARLWPALANWLTHGPATGNMLRRQFGLVDLPVFRPARFDRRHRLDAAGWADLPEATRERSVILLPDSFTVSFDGAVPGAAVRLLENLGYRVFVAPIRPNGKARHVLGMLDAFRRTSRKAQDLRAWAGSFGAPLVSLDAASGLLFAQEYEEFAPLAGSPPVLGIEEFLVREIEAGRIAPKAAGGGAAFEILLHCTEKTARPVTADYWARIFRHLGLSASMPPSGCCGMAGMFGHEAEHAAMSRQLFDMSWRQHLTGKPEGRVLATGFSCRCQSERILKARPPHPVEALAVLTEGFPA